ncbi:NrfD/PsrC family molybdoenzyme membrane anchor subunit, partial [Gordonibacter sp.]|uniref:NrfD/PsrC family molybdoenzyme membrane anchor subunit n=1 Tax=Gordonibacter sp. TaxID=1968902 RepID=UPI002FC70047
MFSDLVVGYLFLGGTGAGMSLVLSLLGLLVPRESVPGARRMQGGVAAWYRALFVPGYAVSLLLLVVGVVCLLADVGAIDRALLLFVQPSLSFLAVGAWVLAACSLLTLALALMWQSRLTWRTWVTRLVQGGAVVAALVAATYTGLLLQSMPSVPLWASWWLPALFVLSAVSCGIAGVLGVAQFTGASRRFAEVLRRLAVADVVVIVLEAVAVAFFAVLAATAALPGGESTATDAAASASA